MKFPRLALLTLVLALPPVHAQKPEIVPKAQGLSQGFSQERLKHIGQVMAQEIEKGTMPGAVTLIARNGKIVHFEAHGWLDSEKKRPMVTNAVFRALSMTKPFVSVAAMMLVEQGRMKLSDPISNWIPEMKNMKVLVEKKDATGKVTREAVPATRQITVQDLLRHTSGLTYMGSAPFPEIKEAYAKADIESRESDVSPDELVQRLAAIPLAWEPGTHWEYSVSVDVLGVLLERVTGTRLDRLLDTMIFKPLKMVDTGFQLAPNQRARLADAFDSVVAKLDCAFARVSGGRASVGSGSAFAARGLVALRWRRRTPLVFSRPCSTP